MTIGLTSEIIIEQYGIKRETLDEFSYFSHKKSSYATNQGFFKDEIISMKVLTFDKKRNKKIVKVIDSDDGIRHNLSLKKMMDLKPVFKKNGLTTAGNAS